MKDKPKIEDFYDVNDPRGCSSSELNKYEIALKEWEENNYSPYCDICTGCGESGCCSPVACEQDPDGKYCEGNLNELKFGYLMFEDLYSLISKDKRLIDEAKDIYDKNWEIIFGEEK